MGKEHSMERLTARMIAYDAGDPRRIQHFLKVYQLAHTIGVLEGLDPETQFVLDTAALVHDIGIHKAERLHGNGHGKYQEMEGPGEAEALLEELGWPGEAIRRASYLVGHHHTYAGVEGLDYRILLEADFLVNLYEKGAGPEARRDAREKIFRTPTGIAFFEAMFPQPQGETL